MRDSRYARFSDAALLRELAARISQDRTTTADLVALIAEVDARRLYVPAGYASMHAYCVGELRLSDDEAYKRITTARTARRFPTLFTELAKGRLHLTAVCTLAPHLTDENLDELVKAAVHRRRSDIEDFLVLRFPPRTTQTAIPAQADQTLLLPGLAPERVQSIDRMPMSGVSLGTERAVVPELELAPERGRGEVPALAPERVEAAQVHTAQRAVERVFQITIRKSTHEKLRYTQALLSHAIPSGDLSDLLDRALDLLIAKAETRRFGSNKTKAVVPRRDKEAKPTGPSDAARRPSTSTVSDRSTVGRSRYIPASIRRAVWERDGGRCTFVGPKGNRCAANYFLEFDHVDPYARGGKATVEGLRLRCDVHNQFEALREFGAEFIRRKRRERREKEGRRAKEARQQALDVGSKTGPTGSGSPEAPTGP